MMEPVALHGGIEQPLGCQATTDCTVDLDHVDEAGRQIRDRANA